MQTAPTITLRRIRGAEDLDADIRARLARLERYYPAIITAYVLVELAARRHQGGNRYHVRIELALPGEDIAITRDASVRSDLRARKIDRARKSDEPDPGHRYAKVAVREAFETARRRLQDQARRRRGAVKAHSYSRLHPRRRWQAS